MHLSSIVHVVQPTARVTANSSIRNLVVINSYPSVRHKFLWQQLGGEPDINVSDNGSVNADPARHQGEGAHVRAGLRTTYALLHEVANQ